MRGTLSAALALALGLGPSACAHRFQTVVLDPASVTPGASFEGVLFHAPALYRVRYEYRQAVDGSGRHRPGCEPRREEVYEIQPDFDAPLLLRNDPGWLSAGELQATFSGGLLTSVNVESSPAAAETLAAFADLVEAAAPAGLAAAAATTPAGEPLCNTGRAILGRERVR
jgi:hypothetical protein